ncbi:MAG: replication initiator protein A, partial [Comamonadaceae bacterium]|nr:replication initiator protein A [Comamonadaceae bacterium]
MAAARAASAHSDSVGIAAGPPAGAASATPGPPWSTITPLAARSSSPTPPSWMVRVTVLPGATGCATIHDKDLWIYCISQLVEATNRGREITPTVRFTAFDFLTVTNRDTSGRAYERMADMLRRLKGTVVETNIETNGQRERRGFGLIDSWRVVENSLDNDRMVAVEVDLPRWLFRSVEAKRVLTLSRSYFRLRKPLDRRIYELARKHCGEQPSWRVSLAVLHQKSGSTGALRRFRFDLKTLAESGDLPDYLM